MRRGCLIPTRALEKLEAGVFVPWSSLAIHQSKVNEMWEFIFFFFGQGTLVKDIAERANLFYSNKVCRRLPEKTASSHAVEAKRPRHFLFLLAGPRRKRVSRTFIEPLGFFFSYFHSPPTLSFFFFFYQPTRHAHGMVYFTNLCNKVEFMKRDWRFLLVLPDGQCFLVVQYSRVVRCSLENKVL